MNIASRREPKPASSNIVKSHSNHCECWGPHSSQRFPPQREWSKTPSYRPWSTLARPVNQRRDGKSPFPDTGAVVDCNWATDCTAVLPYFRWYNPKRIPLEFPIACPIFDNTLWPFYHWCTIEWRSIPEVIVISLRYLKKFPLLPPRHPRTDRMEWHRWQSPPPLFVPFPIIRLDLVQFGGKFPINISTVTWRHRVWTVGRSISRLPRHPELDWWWILASPYFPSTGETWWEFPTDSPDQYVIESHLPIRSNDCTWQCRTFFSYWMPPHPSYPLGPFVRNHSSSYCHYYPPTSSAWQIAFVRRIPNVALTLVENSVRIPIDRPCHGVSMVAMRQKEGLWFLVAVYGTMNGWIQVGPDR